MRIALEHDLLIRLPRRHDERAGADWMAEEVFAVVVYGFMREDVSKTGCEMLEEWRERLRQSDDKGRIVRRAESRDRLRRCRIVIEFIGAFNDILKYPESCCKAPRIAGAFERIANVR